MAAAAIPPCRYGRGCLNRPRTACIFPSSGASLSYRLTRPDLRAASAVQGPAFSLVSTDLLESLLDALREGDLDALREVATDAVYEHAGLQTQRQASQRYYMYRVLSRLDLSEIRPTPGFGVRYKLPLLATPIRVDFGFNPDRRELVLGQLERLMVLHIALGQAF